MYYLGIDPGVRTGYCIYNRKDGIVQLGTTDFFGVIDLGEQLIRHIQAEFPDFDLKDKLALVIEDPAQNENIFLVRYKMENLKDVPTVRKALKLAQNVGANKREGTLLIDYFKRKGCRVIAIQPTKKKWDKAQFWQITKYNEKKRISQHAIDACRMVYGR